MNKGNVSSWTTGFTRKFTSPKISATRIRVRALRPVLPPSSVMLPMSQMATASAPALAIVLTTKFFMCLIVADMIGGGHRHYRHNRQREYKGRDGP